MYANIIIDITHEKLDKIFQYHIPSELEGMLEIGTEVIVPFGKGNRAISGYIIGFSETSEYDAQKIKDSIAYAKDLKDRYTVLWLYYDLFGIHS